MGVADCEMQGWYHRIGMTAGSALWIFALAGMILGCGGSSSPAPASKTTVTAVPATPPQAVEAKPEGTPSPLPPIYMYSQGNRRDPFRSILVSTDAAKRMANLPPLQRTEVGDLRLIGVVWGEYGYSAMVQTPDGKGYTVRVGTLVGPNSGKVKRISQALLTVEEKYTDIFGEKKVREVNLDLHPEEEQSE